MALRAATVSSSSAQAGALLGHEEPAVLVLEGVGRAPRRLAGRARAERDPSGDATKGCCSLPFPARARLGLTHTLPPPNLSHCHHHHNPSQDAASRRRRPGGG